MKILLYFFAIFFISCGTSKKIKSATKSELIETTDSVSIQTTETIEISEKEIKEVLTALDFEFIGEQNDSAKIEIHTTDNSIIVKVSGKAQAKLKATEQSKSESNTNISEKTETAVKRAETAKKETVQTVIKDKKKFVVPIWIWIVFGAIILFILYQVKKRLHL